MNCCESLKGALTESLEQFLKASLKDCVLEYLQTFSGEIFRIISEGILVNYILVAVIYQCLGDFERKGA